MFKRKILIAAVATAAAAILFGCSKKDTDDNMEFALASKPAPAVPQKKSNEDIFDEFYMVDEDRNSADKSSAAPVAAQRPKNDPAPERAAPPAPRSNDSYNIVKNGPYVVQVATASSRPAAQKLTNELKGAGYPAYVAEVRNPTPALQGLYFRVRIGSFNAYSEAKNFGQNALVSAGYDYWVDKKSNDNVGIEGSGFGGGAPAQQYAPAQTPAKAAPAPQAAPQPASVPPAKNAPAPAPKAAPATPAQAPAPSAVPAAVPAQAAPVTAPKAETAPDKKNGKENKKEVKADKKDNKQAEKEKADKKDAKQAEKEKKEDKKDAKQAGKEEKADKKDSKQAEKEDTKNKKDSKQSEKDTKANKKDNKQSSKETKAAAPPAQSAPAPQAAPAPAAAPKTEAKPAPAAQPETSKSGDDQWDDWDSGDWGSSDW